MSKLNAEQIARRLKAIPDWKRRNQVIARTFEFQGFLESIKFVDRIAKKAEAMNHHPDMDIRWNKVTLALTTHDQRGLTENDFLLAQQCDKVFSRF